MRTMHEIHEAVSLNQEVTYDELFYAVAAMGQMHILDRNSLLGLIDSDINPTSTISRWWERWHHFGKADPKEWLGDRDPRSPEMQERRKFARELQDKIGKAAAGK